jgi:glutamate dehydrogenase/leucine dehydrogenase
MAAVFRATRFVTCIPPALGGSGNPSIITARGLVVAMEAAFDELGLGTLAGKRIAIEGVGNVGSAMIGFLLERGAGSIVASDISAERIEDVRARYAGQPVELRLTGRDDHSILSEECDVLAPCALGGVLNTETIPGIRARIICGSANNQLADEVRDCAAIEARGIPYVPDFVANRMGIVSCANEQYGYPDPDPAIERHLGRDWENGIYQTVRQVLARAGNESITAVEAAGRLADELATVPHPIWPGRWRQVIETVTASDWASRAG